MKNILFSSLIILALTATFASAQDQPKISFAVLGGVNFQNLNGKASNGDKLVNDMMLGYHLGGNVQIPIAQEFYFQPGLMFSTKGDKNKSAESTSTTSLNYIEMPLNMVYKASLGSGFIMVGFGPYLGYGIGGKRTTSGSSPTVEDKIVFKNVIETSDDQGLVYYKAFDAGANIFAGYEMANGVFCQLNTQLGMLKINPEYSEYADDKTSVKNTGFGLSTGYRF